MHKPNQNNTTANRHARPSGYGANYYRSILSFGVVVICFCVPTLLPHDAVAQGHAPAQAVKQLWATNGMRATLFAHEPEVRQPIFVQCDDRGRLWTIQYLQYPNPAGLKRVQVDRWSRTVYDQIPLPPPHGPRGADKITVLEDRDGDGQADHFTDFVTGLNLTTGVAFGHGGVFVLNVPYLLFYPDRDRDCVPDSNPLVLLEGFGMEDAQSFSNHLTWGPDGWLYGVNGSTTTCKIRGIEFQQGVWRYHPVRQEFELFCEGGANCYGLTFDDRGNLFYSTNGGPFVHGLQGGYFYKSFGKHGPLHNAYAYHYFGPLECDQAPGGPPTGGTIYRHELFRKTLGGQFICGNFLGHTASAWSIAATGSTFRAKYAGPFLDVRDTWSGPTDLCIGPRGEIYIADFYDQRTAHPDPDATWDITNGRIYRLDAPVKADSSIATDHAMIPPVVDVREVDSPTLVELLCGSSAASRESTVWLKDRALVELASRRDKTVLPRLDQLITDSRTLQLTTIWARYVTDGLPDHLVQLLLEHHDENVRAWAIRLAADDKRVSPELANRFVELAERETSPVVRLALATSAKRLPPEQCLPVVWSLLELEDKMNDERVDWSIWWALESQAISASEMIENWVHKTSSRTGRLTSRLRNLLVRRYAAEGTDDSYTTCVRIIRSVPASQRREAFSALRDGLTERANQPQGIGQGGLFEFAAVRANLNGSAAPQQLQPVNSGLRELIAEYWNLHRDTAVALELGLLTELPDAHHALTDFVKLHSSSSASDVPADSDRHDKLELLVKYARHELLPELLQWYARSSEEALSRKLLQVLARFEDESVADRLISTHAGRGDVVRQTVYEVLLSRKTWSRKLLTAVVQGFVRSQDISISQIASVALHQDAELDAMVGRIWGKVGPGTPEEKLAIMRRFNNDLRAATGNAEQGKPLFTKVCGNCHKLYGQGGEIGPDLTSTSRKDSATLLANIVDPSSVIRREYLSYVVRTTSGSVLTGLIAEQNAATITIVDAENRRTKIGRDELEEIRESAISIMPERLLEQLSPQQLRDLFAYLQDK